MKSFPFLLTIFLAAILGRIGPALGQQRPSLDVPTLDSSGTVNLLVRGDRGTNYAIETSSDLTVWWKLFSGVASNGQAQFSYVPPVESESRYFRARMEVPQPALNVTVQLDTNNVDVALLTSDRSATLSLTDGNGTTYTLTVPTNAVPQPAVFYMTMVTNLSGLPFAAGELGAVSIVPAGLALQSPAQLEITFPTNINLNPGSVIAYGFDEDGSFLRLTLGFSETNRITIPVLTLGGFGCSIATLSEVEQLSQRPVGGVGISNTSLQKLVRRPRSVQEGYPLDECHPEDLLRANQVEKIIANRFAQLNSDLTFNALQTLRRIPGLGGNPLRWNVPWLGNQDGFWHDFYQQNIAPFLTEAERNCALTDVMARQVSALDAIEQSFGVFFHDSTLAESSLCRGYENCISVIDQCCKEKGLDGQPSIDAAQAYADKAAKLASCRIDSALMDQVKKDCGTTNWSGSIDIHTSIANTNVTISGSLSIVYTDREDCYLFCRTDGKGLNGSSAGPGYYGITGPLTVSAFCFFDEKIVTTDTSCCRPCVSTLTAKAQALADGRANSGFVWELTNSPPPPFPIPLQNVVVPGQELILATHNVIKPNHIKADFWKSIKGAPCIPDPKHDDYNVTYDFGGIVYLNILTVPQGTAARFAGHWETNFVSEDGTKTTQIMANWRFDRGTK